MDKYNTMRTKHDSLFYVIFVKSLVNRYRYVFRSPCISVVKRYYINTSVREGSLNEAHQSILGINFKNIYIYNYGYYGIGYLILDELHTRHPVAGTKKKSNIIETKLIFVLLGKNISTLLEHQIFFANYKINVI